MHCTLQPQKHRHSRAFLWFLQKNLRPNEFARAWTVISTAPQSANETYLIESLFIDEKRRNVLLECHSKETSLGNNGLRLVTRPEVESLLNRPCPDRFPFALRYEGNINILARPKIGIIGSRHPTYYGRQQAHRFARDLVRQGFCVVSGGAIGIDAIANSGAHEHGGCSLAVIGSGMSQLYPVSNVPLFRNLISSDRGLVMSEFDDVTPPCKWNFPRRNHTIAALVDFLLVVEAAGTSGSLITATAALEAGVDVGALPGPVDSLTSEGTNLLLKNGAFCIQSPTDVISRIHSLTLTRRSAQNFTPSPITG